MVAINVNLCKAILPGMLASAETLIVKSQSERNEGVSTKNSAGILTSAIILSVHCAELLLKYKIHEEGKKVIKTHDLCKLFNKLNPDFRASVETEFKRLILTSNLKTIPNGWESTKSVFQKARGSGLTWRYGVDPGDTNKSTYPLMIYTGAISIYNTIVNEKKRGVWRTPTIPFKKLQHTMDAFRTKGAGSVLEETIYRMKSILYTIKLRCQYMRSTDASLLVEKECQMS